MLAGVLDEESLKLYTLIWSRTVSCQMEPAIFEQVRLLIPINIKHRTLKSYFKLAVFYIVFALDD